MMNTTEAADLARVILDDTVREHPLDLYTLHVHEARTLARAVRNAANLADRLDDEANRMGSRGGAFTARAFAAEIRAALKGGTNV
jgi:hypothetical protein